MRLATLGLLVFAALTGRAAACPVDATDPRSGFPDGFSLCWNEGTQISRVDTLAVLTDPAAYGPPGRSLPIGYVLLDTRPPYDAALFIKEGRLYVLANPIADPADLRKTLTGLLALAERLQKRFPDFIVLSRKTPEIWRAFARGDDIGFESLTPGGKRVSKPAVNTELFESIKALGIGDDFDEKLEGLSNEELASMVNFLDGRITVNGTGISAPALPTIAPQAREALDTLEGRFYSASLSGVEEELENDPIPEGDKRLYCYSEETGRFDRQPPGAAQEYVPGFDYSDGELVRITGCLEGRIFVHTKENPAWFKQFDFRNK